jgi:hypothetical protein
LTEAAASTNRRTVDFDNMMSCAQGCTLADEVSSAGVFRVSGMVIARSDGCSIA